MKNAFYNWIKENWGYIIIIILSLFLMLVGLGLLTPSKGVLP